MHLRILLFLLLGAGPGILTAQHQEIDEAPQPYKGREQIERDTLSILSAFKHGKVNGHFRYFFMATNNSRDLTDYFANAAGGSIRFETASFYGFRFAVGGSYVFNIASSDLTIPDSATGQYSRYEIGLFDVEDPKVTTGLDRLEELYLSYSWGQSEVSYGRQFINTPFINLQDGRMRPGAVEGVVLRFKEWSKTTLESGFLYAMSPRSTDSWYSVENSIGIYASGVNPDGSKSDYHGHTRSKGVLYGGVNGKWFKNLTIQGWNFLVLNVMNTAMLQLDMTEKIKAKNVISASAQVIRQDGSGEGGNENESQSYFLPNSKSLSFGFKLGYTSGRFATNLNYTRITSSGRYLMPREWGRDPLFTFLPRERNEGFGDVHAVMGRITYALTKNNFSVGLSGGYYNLPDVTNTPLNKYGIPSYIQTNIEVRYFFKGLFEGLDIQYLLAAKYNAGETYDNPKYVFNKVNMQVHNVVLNFHF